MCELLALSASHPVRLTFSLQTLAERGGMTGRMHDGWGVAFYQGQDVALFREPAPAADSALVRFLETQGPATDLAISHIRHATRGAVTLANTQPFVRKLGGSSHVFAHNGNLADIERIAGLARVAFQPLGQTDSELAFCALLARLAPLWADAKPPALAQRLAVLAEYAAELRTLGPANFLYADGDALFAHGHRRLQPASGLAEAPGLWYLQRTCPAEGSDDAVSPAVSVGSAARSVVLLASVPLSDEAWIPLQEGESLVLRAGGIVRPTEA